MNWQQAQVAILPATFPINDLGFLAVLFLKYCFSMSTTATPLMTILRWPDTVSRPKQMWYQEWGIMGTGTLLKVSCWNAPVEGCLLTVNLLTRYKPSRMLMKKLNQCEPFSVYIWTKCEACHSNLSGIEAHIVKLTGKLDFGSLAREMKSAMLDSIPNLWASSLKLNVE